MHSWESSPFIWFFTFLCCQGLKYLSAEVFTCPWGRLISSRRLINCLMSRQIPVLSETETDSETTVYYVIGAILYRTLGIILPAPQWVHLPREHLSNIFIAARHRKAFQSESFRLILSVSFILPLNISPSPTSFISRQLFISFEFACLNPHSPPFYFSLLLSLLPHNASTASHSYLPPLPDKKKLHLPWVLSTFFRVRHRSVPTALWWHSKCVRALMAPETCMELVQKIEVWRKKIKGLSKRPAWDVGCAGSGPFYSGQRSWQRLSWVCSNRSCLPFFFFLYSDSSLLTPTLKKSLTVQVVLYVGLWKKKKQGKSGLVSSYWGKDENGYLRIFSNNPKKCFLCSSTTAPLLWLTPRS